MATYKWPSTGRNRPVDAVQHATCLKAEFDSVSNAANASLSNTTLLPSGLESRISIGITKGIAEACSNGFCPKWSETDKSIFSKVILKNITNEAALEARDRVPLPQFNGLYESYSTLHSKFITPIPPTATTHQFVGAGASAATEATSVIDLVNAAKKTSEGTDKARSSPEVLANQREEKFNNEESEEDTDEEEEDEMYEIEDAESDQEAMGDGDSVSGDECSEEGSGDDSSSSEDGSETDSETGGGEVGDQDIVRRRSVVPYIKRNGQSISTTLTLRIEQQASVNRLEEMTASELSSCLSSSLKNLLHEQQLSSGIVYISSINLLDSGDLSIVIYAEKREGLQRIPDSASWSQNLEKSLVCWQGPTYKVIMHNVLKSEINSLKFRNRKEKAAIIRRLAEANRAICQSNDKPVIRDICWPQDSLPNVDSSLMVKFLDPEEATRALDLGLRWRKRRHVCGMEDNSEMERCSRCQGYGHISSSCSAPHRCGKCAGQHRTETCKSKKVKCGSCGGGHRAGQKNCPAKVMARKRRSFLKEAVSQTIEPAAEAQAKAPTPIRTSNSAARTQTETSMPSPVSMGSNLAEDEVKSEPGRSLPQVEPTQDDYPDRATLLEKIERLSKENEEIRKIVVAWDGALQTKSSGRTKRRAEEAFEGEAEAESSNMATKRIKQEEPTRQGSMGLYRQPSPFIVHRPQ